MTTNRALFLFVVLLGLAACSRTPSEFESDDLPSQNHEQGGGGVSNDNPPVTPPDSGPTINKIPMDDSKIVLDSFGESFVASNATRLLNSRYMERNCQSVTTWGAYKDLPMKKCRYSSSGQTAEVLMLNPGPRRLTMWLEEACGSLAGNFNNCMTSAFSQILNQSGGQFPVAGIVLEDMDGNGRGNAYVFRNGVTVQIASVGTGSESTLTSTQIANSFTETVKKTYTYARPISATREQLTAYAAKVGLSIPALGASSAQGNNFNEVVGNLYRQAWSSSQNHIIRAWVYAKKF